MKLRAMVLGMLSSLVIASPAPASSAFAEVVATLVSFDRATQTATYRVDTLYQVVPAQSTRVDSVLVVTCNILGPKPWTTVLRKGQTLLTVTLTRQGNAWLELPSDGWRFGCRCAKKPEPKEVALFAMFMTDQGLANRIRAKGGSPLLHTVTLGLGGKVRLPQQIRLRLGWSRGLLDGTAVRSEDTSAASPAERSRS